MGIGNPGIILTFLKGLEMFWNVVIKQEINVFVKHILCLGGITSHIMSSRMDHLVYVISQSRDLELIKGYHQLLECSN